MWLLVSLSSYLLQKDAEPLLTLDASKNHSHLSHHHNMSAVYRSVTWL